MTELTLTPEQLANLNGSPFTADVKRDCDPLPQPAPALPHHHAPKLAPGQRYPIVRSSTGHPIGTAVVFEDEEVIVWENRTVSGMKGALHCHDHDYWIVSPRVTGGGSQHKMRLMREDVENYKPVYNGQGGNPGVIFVKKGHVETADNDGEPGQKEPNPAAFVYLCEIKTGGRRAEHPAGFGAAAGIIYENTEFKVWDLRVPPGQAGAIPAENQNSLFHCDVHGIRRGGADVAAMLVTGTTHDGTTVADYAFGRKKWGNAYYRAPGSDGGAPSAEGAVAGQAINDGAESYRAIIFEIKPGEPQITARL